MPRMRHDGFAESRVGVARKPELGASHGATAGDVLASVGQHLMHAHVK